MRPAYGPGVVRPQPVVAHVPPPGHHHVAPPHHHPQHVPAHGPVVGRPVYHH